MCIIHKWSKWKDAPLLVSPGILKEFKPYTVVGQQRVCLKCNKRELKQ